jgi:hypothetical protein
MAVVSLPYLVTPGSIKTGLERIKAAATPDRVTGDFVKTKLNIKGGTGDALIPFLKKIGFVAPDGSPTEIYRRYRNDATAGQAVAEAVRVGYKELEKSNEYFYDLDDKGLLSLIVQVTGAEVGSKVASLTMSTIKQLKQFADFEYKSAAAASSPTESVSTGSQDSVSQFKRSGNGIGLNLAYTINLNLPATSDQAVFNAIFRSLKENLLADND